MDNESYNSAVGDSPKTDFQKAGEWFFNLPYDEMIAICKEANPKTPHSLNDNDLVSIWKKHSK